MRKMLLASLLLLPGQAHAGPPEGVPGRMAFDEVASWVRRYDRETDWSKRLWLLANPPRDPDARVGAVYRAAARQAPSKSDSEEAACLLAEHYLGVKAPTDLKSEDARMRHRLRLLVVGADWIHEQEAAEERHRRAKQPPQ
jgi:hypothetical protein